MARNMCTVISDIDTDYGVYGCGGKVSLIITAGVVCLYKFKLLSTI